MLLVSLSIAISSNAQYPFSHSTSNPTGAITNTSVDTSTFTLTRSYGIVTIQPTVTKASGTMTGWSVLEYSTTGTNWVLTGDTLSLGNTTNNSTIWNKTTAAQYWRIRTGGATSVAGTTAHKISAH